MRRQLGWRALVSLIFLWGEMEAESAHDVTPMGSVGCISVPEDVCMMYLVYMGLNKSKKWSDIFLHLL